MTPLKPGIGASFYGELARDLPRQASREVIDLCQIVCLHTQADHTDKIHADFVRAVNPVARVWLAIPANYLSRLDLSRGRAAVLTECDRVADIATAMSAELLEPNGEGQSGGRKPGDWTAPPDDPTEIARLESLGEEVFERLETRLASNGAKTRLGWTSHDDTRSFLVPRGLLRRVALHSQQHYPADKNLTVTQRIIERRVAWSQGRWEALAEQGIVEPEVCPRGARWGGYYQGHGHTVGALVWALSESPVARLWACPGSWSPEAVEALRLARKLRGRVGTGDDAVEKFQRAEGLDGDGAVGPKTLDALRAIR